MEKVIIRGGKLVTESGREVILHGVNVLARSRENGHVYPDIEKKFPLFVKMGFNLLRYGIFWDAVEPQPGVFDTEYLNRTKEIVRLAEEHGIYVILDMHQDLFAQKFIDGAPDWACLDEGLPHPEHCTLWYNAYLESDAIIRAADNFWANKPAADGVGLLDHYEKMWEVIAAHLDDCTNVIGFEPMNEPFMGSLAREAFGLATMKMLEKNPTFDLANPDAIPPEQAVEFMSIVSERLYEFDRTTLMDFYRRMHRAIRRHSSKALVTGGNIYCSTNVPTGIERLEDGNQIYAPHGYDSVVDSDRYDSFSKENVEMIYADKRRSQERLGLPTIVGEWGAFPSAEFTGDLIRHMNGIIEKNLWGSAYCEFNPAFETTENFTALCRAYPTETAGELKSYHYDDAEKRFEMSFDAVAGGETVIFCPFVPQSVECSLAHDFRIERTADDRCICRLTVNEAGSASVVIA